MLPIEYRLPAKDIAMVSRKGKSRNTDMLLLKFLPENGLEYPQFGISISKKIDKRAVVRNRIKRRIRAGLLELLHSREPEEIPMGKYLFIVRSANLAQKDVDVAAQVFELVNK